MRDYEVGDLEEWTQRISVLARDLGLDCYPQEFEICDHNQMLGSMAYSGLPSHYPHWSYGKSFEKLKTLYDYGVTGLPYEMVINSNPCLAYLMRDNSLLLQILTIAHVFAHNDFFKNNYTFQSTRPEWAVGRFKVHANRIRRYAEDPSIGPEGVERVLDPARALAFQCRRNLAGPKLTPKQQREKVKNRFLEQYRNPFPGLHKSKEFDEEAYRQLLKKTPPEPDEDILLFIRDHGKHPAAWEKDILTIVDEETRYFIPQAQTKIMNEGWASYWHKTILDSLDLPQEMRLEFIARHAQVLAPQPGGLNPYHLGFEIWNALRIWYDGMLDRSQLRKDEQNRFEEMRRDFEERDAIPPGSGQKSGREVLFQTRESERDTSFIRRFLTPVLMRELDLFEHQLKEESPDRRVRVVTRVSDRDQWQAIKQTLIRNVGTSAIPVIKVEDGNYHNDGSLLLEHDHDGRDLELGSAEKTLGYVYQLWGSPVVLRTRINNHSALLQVDSKGQFSLTTRDA
ncbi:MAG: SpoVR family protein [Acidobacteriota bacterium]